MAILAEFERFREPRKSEANFASRFLLPLLERLGFYEVRNYHGGRELGKDVVFAEVDKVGQIAFHGLQAKFEASLSVNDMEGLITDCKQAFRHPFRHPTTGKEERITTFYVANAGSIGHDARDNFYSGVGEFRGCTRVFDGPELLALDCWASIKSNSRESLVGLLMELRYNENLLQRIGPGLVAITQGDGNNVQYPVWRLRLDAVASYLSTPFLTAHLPREIVERFWAHGMVFNRALDEAASSPLHTVVSIKIPAAKAVQTIPQLVQDAAVLKQVIDQTLLSLGPLAAK